MRRLLSALLLLLALALPVQATAHQLDEYLQAARVAFARDRVALELDLTPGANIAGDIVGTLDRDGDGVVLPLEARAYGEAVIRDLEMAFDGRPVRLALSAIEVPAIDDMHRGTGTMQLTAVGVVDGARAGRHRLQFTNRHRPSTSVYLANALVSGDRDVQVVAQRRDRRQQQFDVEYAIAPRWSAHLLWVLFGGMLVVRGVAGSRGRPFRSLPARAKALRSGRQVL